MKGNKLLKVKSTKSMKEVMFDLGNSFRDLNKDGFKAMHSLLYIAAYAGILLNKESRHLLFDYRLFDLIKNDICIRTGISLSMLYSLYLYDVVTKYIYPRAYNIYANTMNKLTEQKELKA